jgi:hypothetical protein
MNGGVTGPYPVQNPRAAWRVYDGEAVIISPDDSTMHTLNAVGTLIWEAADGRTPLASIVARICAEFDVDAPRAEREALGFIDTLCRRGLLTLADAPAVL